MENTFSTDSINVQPKGPREFYSGNCALGKVEYPDISRAVGQSTEMQLILPDTKCHHAFLEKVEVTRNGIMNGVLVKVSILVHRVCEPIPQSLSGPKCTIRLTCLLVEVIPTLGL